MAFVGREYPMLIEEEAETKPVTAKAWGGRLVGGAVGVGAAALGVHTMFVLAATMVTGGVPALFLAAGIGVVVGASLFLAGDEIRDGKGGRRDFVGGVLEGAGASLLISELTGATVSLYHLFFTSPAAPSPPPLQVHDVPHPFWG